MDSKLLTGMALIQPVTLFYLLNSLSASTIWAVPVCLVQSEAIVTIAYGVLKFLHIVSVIAWVGGVLSLSVVTWRLTSERNREVLAALLRQATSFGQMIAGPASFIVLLTGPAMVGMAHIGFGTLWVLAGFAGLTVHFWLGATLLRTRTTKLAALASANSGDDAALLAAARRLWSAQLIYLGLLALVVAAMVLKPTL
jgi:uncharacterized membrane protein